MPASTPCICTISNRSGAHQYEGERWQRIEFCPLHAAAPALLEALECIANVAECVAVNEAQVKMFNWDGVVSEARAAIAQAKGDSK